jgi:hypothetical protein
MEFIALITAVTPVTRSTPVASTRVEATTVVAMQRRVGGPAWARACGRRNYVISSNVHRW